MCENGHFWCKTAPVRKLLSLYFMYRQWVAELRFVSALGLEWVDGVQGGGHYLFVDGRWKGAAGSHTGTRTRRRRAVVGERIAAQRAGWLGWAGLDRAFRFDASATVTAEHSSSSVVA